MDTLQSVAEVQQFIKQHPFTFLYVSRTNCSVCHALLPKVNEMLTEFPTIQTGFINADDVPDIAGYLSIFTVPVLLSYVNGKEMIREARFVQMNDLKDKMAKIYALANEE